MLLYEWAMWAHICWVEVWKMWGIYIEDVLGIKKRQNEKVDAIFEGGLATNWDPHSRYQATCESFGKTASCNGSADSDSMKMKFKNLDWQGFVRQIISLMKDTAVPVLLARIGQKGKLEGEHSVWYISHSRHFHYSCLWWTIDSPLSHNKPSPSFENSKNTRTRLVNGSHSKKRLVITSQQPPSSVLLHKIP